MNHDEFKDLIIDYIEDKLDEDLRFEFDVHKADCDDCRREFLLEIEIEKALLEGSLQQGDIIPQDELEKLKSEVLKTREEKRVAYKKLCSAFKEKNWEEVIRLGNELEEMDYDEEIHPIRKLVFEATYQIMKKDNELLSEETFDEFTERLINDKSFSDNFDKDAEQTELRGLKKLGDAFIFEKQYDKAIERLERANELAPDDADIISKLSGLYLHVRNKEKLKDLYKNTPKELLSPSDLHNAYVMGIKDLDEHDRNAIEKNYEKVLEIKPDHAATIQLLAYIYFDNNKHFKAIDILEKCAHRSSDKHIQKLLALFYLIAGDLDNAQISLHQYDVKYPDNPEILGCIGAAYTQKREFEKAIKYLKKADKLSPKDPVIFKHFFDYYAKGDLDNAFKYLLASFKLFPMEKRATPKILASYSNNFAVLEWMMGEFEIALEHISAAAHIESNNLAIQHNYELMQNSSREEKIDLKISPIMSIAMHEKGNEMQFNLI